MERNENATISSNTQGNPYHKPAGAPNKEGGQFTSADGQAGGGNSDMYVTKQIVNPYYREYEGEFWLIDQLLRRGKISEQEFLRRFDKLQDKYYEAAIPIVMKQTGMRESECYEFIFALKDYCGTEYEFLDRADQIRTRDTIKYGLSRMPKFKGEIYRGMSFDLGDKEEIAKGKQFIERMINNLNSKGAVLLNKKQKLSSFSSDYDVAAGKFAQVNNDGFMSVVLRVKSNHSGTAIAHISPFDGTEDEVLVPDEVLYNVVNVRSAKKGKNSLYYYIDLEEIEE